MLNAPAFRSSSELSQISTLRYKGRKRHVSQTSWRVRALIIEGRGTAHGAHALELLGDLTIAIHSRAALTAVASSAMIHTVS